MAYLDRIRFVAGDEQEDQIVKVWQGYDADARNGSANFPMVLVTADTLRQMADYQTSYEVPSEGFWHSLAFGGDYDHPKSAVTAPDGVTPLYLVSEWTVAIVQRWDPDGGRAYSVYEEVDGRKVKVGEKHFGAWFNEDALTGYPDPQGFVYDPAAFFDGRGDTPPFARYGECAEVGCSDTAMRDGSIYCRDHNGLVDEEDDVAVIAAGTLSQAALVEAANEAIALNEEAYPNAAFAEGVVATLTANQVVHDVPECALAPAHDYEACSCICHEDEPKRYVVDVLVPIAIEAFADNEEQAASMALDALEESGTRTKINDLVNNDWDSGFRISDSPAQTEVGEG